MAYTKRIVCLAKSTKGRGACIAGREWTLDGFGPWIRPVSRPTAEISPDEYCYDDASPPKLLDIIEMDLAQPVLRGHQTENHLIDTTRRWVKRGTLPFAALKKLREWPPSLWAGSGHTHAGVANCVSDHQAAAFRHSLFLIEARDLAVELARATPSAPVTTPSSPTRPRNTSSASPIRFSPRNTKRWLGASGSRWNVKNDIFASA